MARGSLGVVSYGCVDGRVVEGSSVSGLMLNDGGMNGIGGFICESRTCRVADARNITTSRSIRLNRIQVKGRSGGREPTVSIRDTKIASTPATECAAHHHPGRIGGMSAAPSVVYGPQY